MAEKTVCQTPNAVYSISISGKKVAVMVELPGELDLTTADVRLLESNIHNALELVLARYFSTSSLKPFLELLSERSVSPSPTPARCRNEYSVNLESE